MHTHPRRGLSVIWQMRRSTLADVMYRQETVFNPYGRPVCIHTLHIIVKWESNNKRISNYVRHIVSEMEYQRAIVPPVLLTLPLKRFHGCSDCLHHLIWLRGFDHWR